MIKYESACVGCATPGYPCEGAKCPNYSVPVFYCDECGSEVEDLWWNHGKQVCEECLLKSHTKVSVTDDEN